MVEVESRTGRIVVESWKKVVSTQHKTPNANIDLWSRWRLFGRLDLQACTLRENKGLLKEEEHEEETM